MKKYYNLCFILISLMLSIKVSGQSNTFVDYQNYNHGYCPTCNCYPCKCGAVTPPPAPVEEPPPAVDEGDGAAAACAPPPAEPCAPPDPCNPAPVCGTECGLSVVAVGAAIVLVAAAGAIIVSLSNEASTAHSHNP